LVIAGDSTMRRVLAVFNLAIILIGGIPSNRLHAESRQLKIATFQIVATPPIGSPLCVGAVEPVKEIIDPLSARGIVILGSGQPIVLCAVDWVGIANGGYDAFRESLAQAAGTSADRVTVHTLHQHDAPGCDFEAEGILATHGIGGTMFDVPFARRTIARAAKALREAMKSPVAVTHIGTGRGRVEKVASSRRPLGANGKVKFVRWSSGNNAEVRAEPEGTIDPDVRLISFGNEARPVAVLTYYAVHPMAFYGKGGVSADFAGVARGIRQSALHDVPCIHFNGAGGDVTAGKYNGGTPADRQALGERMAAGMKKAWDTQRKVPISANDVAWRTTEAALPINPNLHSENVLLHEVGSKTLRMVYRIKAATNLAWLRRENLGHKMSMSCLRLGPAYVLHMPGELSVEYQLAAQKVRPDDFVCLAAYGDYGPGYICMSRHYSQGGYEPTASRVGPAVEGVLFAAIDELLK